MKHNDPKRPTSTQKNTSNFWLFLSVVAGRGSQFLLNYVCLSSLHLQMRSRFSLGRAKLPNITKISLSWQPLVWFDKQCHAKMKCHSCCLDKWACHRKPNKRRHDELYLEVQLLGRYHERTTRHIRSRSALLLPRLPSIYQCFSPPMALVQDPTKEPVDRLFLRMRSWHSTRLPLQVSIAQGKNTSLGQKYLPPNGARLM